MTPLLLIHGTGGDRGLWAEIERQLSGEYRVLSYDRRGHGRNPEPVPAPRGAYETHAGDAASVISEAGTPLGTVGEEAYGFGPLGAPIGAGNPAWIVGWSAGGLVALALAMRMPERVLGLVLIEPPLHARRFGDLPLWAGYARMKLFAAFGQRRAAARAFLRVIDPDGFDRLPPERKEAILARAPAILAEIAAGTGEEWTDSDLAARVRCPTAFVVGGRSPRPFVAIAEHFAPLLQAPIVRVEQCGHFLPVEDPVACARAIKTAMRLATATRAASGR